jgi:predicted nucleic acid-binding protein
LVKRVLLDTGPLTAYIEGRQGALENLGIWFSRKEAVTSGLVFAEIHEHFLGQPNNRANRRALRTLLRAVPAIRLSYAVLERYGVLRRQLRRPYGAGTIGDIDTLIAATALEHDLTVITTDSDFMRVPGLKVLMLPSTLKSPRST